MRNKMVDSWHPLRGISITDIGDKRCLFRFFYEVDMNQLLEGTPWFFNNHLLILHKFQLGEDSFMAPLIYVKFYYEKISLFYFTCSKPGHGESFCPVRVTVESSKITFGWDISLKALWRIAPLIASQRLREPGSSKSQLFLSNKGLTIWEPAINNVGPNDTRLMELGSNVEDNPFSLFNDKNKQRTIGEIPIVSANVDSV
ncbi:hypothetical protein Gohar_018975 [Gossypium harknessii]|uniref:DUF4283 domain-containing protein n=1 Tax=Gossypium harknessii TaxID=34285 RepID=A0A7J9GAR4_9ROSI|nr:hypothetical protein [Gossypium harknessii]